jgi:BirA family biotin operon repressor/biotin-[acetyl-CoA-carboxylase] ligase
VRPSSFAVLRRLAPGLPVPAHSFDCSAAALREALAELAAHGVEARETSAGWQLVGPFDALDADAIGRALGSAARHIAVEVIDECESTNALLAARADAGAAAGTAIACELQTAGRGRRGAPWLSGLGTGLTFSLLWRCDRGGTMPGGLSLAVGVACAAALESVGARGVRLKWPNDLLFGEAKLGGILVEAQSRGEGATDVVIGIGVNVRMPAQARAAVPQSVADLAEAGVRTSRNAILGALLAELDAALVRFGDSGFSAFRAEWTRRHAWQGRNVRLLVPPSRTVEGVATGVADDGALVVDTGRGVERFHSADVTLRTAASGPRA